MFTLLSLDLLLTSVWIDVFLTRILTTIDTLILWLLLCLVDITHSCRIRTIHLIAKHWELLISRLQVFVTAGVAIFSDFWTSSPIILATSTVLTALSVFGLVAISPPFTTLISAIIILVMIIKLPDSLTFSWSFASLRNSPSRATIPTVLLAILRGGIPAYPPTMTCYLTATASVLLLPSPLAVFTSTVGWHRNFVSWALIVVSIKLLAIRNHTFIFILSISTLIRQLLVTALVATFAYRLGIVLSVVIVLGGIVVRSLNLVHLFVLLVFLGMLQVERLLMALSVGTPGIMLMMMFGDWVVHCGVRLCHKLLGASSSWPSWTLAAICRTGAWPPMPIMLLERVATSAFSSLWFSESTTSFNLDISWFHGVLICTYLAPSSLRLECQQYLGGFERLVQFFTKDFQIIVQLFLDNQTIKLA